MTGGQPPHLCLLRCCEQLPDRIECLEVGHWIGAWGPADGRLIHKRNVTDQLYAFNSLMRPHLLAPPTLCLLHRRIEYVMDKS